MPQTTMHRTFLTLLPLIFLAWTTPSRATEVTDTVFGFHLTVPDEFFVLPLEPSEPNTLYKYVDREPTPDDPSMVIQVQRLRGLVALGSRMNASEIPQIEGLTTTLQEFDWKGHPLDVMRQTLALPTGVEFVVYGIQYPLAGEAVQLQVGGPMGQDETIYALFSQVAQSFDNTRPLFDGGAAEASRKLSTQERIQKLISGVVRLTLFAVAVLFIFRRVKPALSRRSNDSQ